MGHKKTLFNFLFALLWISSISAEEFAKEHFLPQYLYAVVSVEDWEKSNTMTYIHSTPMDKHLTVLSSKDQIHSILNKQWKGVSEFIIVKLDVKKLQNKLIFEINPGESNKHFLYDGFIPFDAIAEAQLSYNQHYFAR